MEPVKIVSTSNTYVKRFRLQGIRTVFRFNHPPKGINELDWIKKGFDDLVNKMKANTTDDDKLGFTLNSLNFKNNKPGFVSFRPANEVTGNTLWDIFSRIVQSNAETMSSSDTFKISCTRINLPKGSGKRRGGFYNNFQEECAAKKSVVVIRNEDNLCLPRALVVAKAHIKKDKEYKLIMKDRRGRQTIKAEKLIAKAKVQIPADGAGIPELDKFQSHLKKYKITVYKYNTKGREVYYDGINEDAKHRINLLYNDGHYNVITSLTSVFSCSYFCEACHTPYNQKTSHKCSNTCPACRTISPPCKLEYEGMNCPECNLHFKNRNCFLAHQGGICASIKRCTICDKVIRPKDRKSPHVCGEVYCKMCADFKQQNHQCYMRVDKSGPKTTDFLFIMFDFETRQDDHLKDNPEVHLHNVNLCVSQQFCWECIVKEPDEDRETCDRCQERTKVFIDDVRAGDPVVQFLNYVMEVRKLYKKVCVIAHNGQAFDFQFILKYIVEKTKFTPKQIMRGTKVILMELDNVRFIDSLNYFPMPLSVLPKAFDLPPEKKKGYFPHLFNTVDKQSYVGTMPDKKYYCPDAMFDKNYKDFDEWYNIQVKNNYVFDMKRELVEYCKSDVDILARACIQFRKIFLEECNVDPFLEAVTIASACNLAFRRKFLKPETIGLIPEKGYRFIDNQSNVALQWLVWQEEERNVRIEHAGRGREVKIEGLKVDGFDGQVVYEYQGCYYHGCIKCYPYKREDPLIEDPSDSLHLRYERTKAKMAKLSRTGFEIVEIWDCEFKAMKKDKKLTHLDKHPMLQTLPLNPREAFFGGRTGNCKTFHKCMNGETIQYMDVCSLYPAVCKYGKFPVGHPKIHVGHEECIKIGTDVDGLLKCKILPPTDLYHPVLPTRINNKLMFVLCSTCGESHNNSDCKHEDDERALLGVWTMDEIRKALQKGYKMMDMLELWEYEVATYEEGGLFTEFINTFLKMKQEASGYPAWCQSESDQEQYIREYFEHEGILLDKSCIQKNEGRRSLAKLMLVSFWGKLGQRENQPKTVIIREPKEFFSLLTCPAKQVNYVQEVNGEVILVNWQYLEEVGDPLPTTNVVLAAFTTAQARLRLYEHLDALDKQVCYYDTDSIVYIYEEGKHKVQVGDFLGDMTDELAKDYGSGSYITQFVSGGPKTYAFQVYSTKENTITSVCKIKGLTLNLKTSQILNFDTLKSMVLSDSEEITKITETRIRRTEERDIVTVEETKMFKITGPKRKRDGEYDTLPYGFKKQKL